MKIKNIILSFILLTGVGTLAFGSDAGASAMRKRDVKPGIEVLRDRGFDILKGKRVGLVTNASGVDSYLKSTVDILFEAPGVTLVALYGPEHGVRGTVKSGAKVDSYTDPKTGVPVYSIYGTTMEPTQQMLQGVDVMVYDIQDVGTRSYTFISSLGLVMRACAKAGIEVVVLDRPNPLGGEKVEGACVQPGYHSFVSEFAIPYVYGLTVGELAMLINKEGLNKGVRGNEKHLTCKLSVIPMKGWKRSMTYDDTGLPWVLPSPNIPYPQSAIDYPSSGIIGEFDDYVNIGTGYTLPFEAFAAEWIDADELLDKLNSYNIPGVSWRTIHYKPYFGKYKDKMLHGVQYCFTDYSKAYLTLTQFYIVQALHELYPDKDPFDMNPTRLSMFDLVCGTDYVRKEFQKRFKVEDIIQYWKKDDESFKKLSQKYYLYKDLRIPAKKTQK